MFCPGVLFAVELLHWAPWILYTECDTLPFLFFYFSPLTPDVIHTTQGLQYPGVQNPEQGRPGAG